MSLRAKLTDVLVRLYTPESFGRMIEERLGRPRPGVAPDTLIETVVADAEAHQWLAQLVHAASQDRPGDQRLYALAEELGLSGRVSGDPAVPGALQARLSAVGYLDPIVFARVQKLEMQVCRVEVTLAKPAAGQKPKTSGTGFLIGPDLVLTNFHVVNNVFDDTGTTIAAPGWRIECLFDFRKVDAGGFTFNGTPIALDSAKPIVEVSPFDPRDLASGDLDETWGAQHLDYAILRLARRVGEEPPGPVQPGVLTAFPRGWIALQAPTEKEELFLAIMQHPANEPMRIALKPDSIDTTTKWRMRHHTNTDHGSSGSPCFNSNFDLIALHHAGDPSWLPQYNQAVPIAAIIEQLEHRGHYTLLAESRTAEPDDLKLHHALLAGFSLAKFTTFVTRVFAAHIPGLEFSAKLELCVVEVIARARKQRWLADLVVQAALECPACAELQAIRHRADVLLRTPGALQAVAAAAPSFDQCWLNRGVPLINRTGLRKSVETMLTSANSRLLPVRGGRRSGCTQSYRYLQHLHSLGVCELLLPIDLKDVLADEGKLEVPVIAAEIASRLDMTFDVAPEKFKVREFLGALTDTMAKSTGKPRLLAIDDLHLIPHGHEAWKFLSRVWKLVEQHAGSFFLVLLGSDGEALRGELPDDFDLAHVDTTGDLTEDDITDFFIRFHEKVLKPRNPKFTYEPADVADAVEQVLQKANGSGSPNVEKIGTATREVCRSLLMRVG